MQRLVFELVEIFSLKAERRKVIRRDNRQIGIVCRALGLTKPFYLESLPSIYAPLHTKFRQHLIQRGKLAFEPLDKPAVANSSKRGRLKERWCCEHFFERDRTDFARP